jgi:hypothetical protein
MKFLQAVIFTFVIAAGAVLAQNNQIISNGNPPLTRGMIERFVGLIEWSLDVQFSNAERTKIEKQITAYWQTGDEKSIKSILDSLAFEKNLATASAAKKQELQPQVKQQLLETLERESSDSLNAILLGVYNKNQNAGDGGSASNGADLSSLVGKWRVLHGNSIVGVDINSGRIGDGNSMIAEFDIKPNGRVIYSFVLQQSNYGCTTRLKTSKTGSATISGSRVTFDYDGGSTTSEDNCNRRNNYTKKLAAEKETFDFNLTRQSGKTNFCFANSKLKDCAVKVQ